MTSARSSLSADEHLVDLLERLVGENDVEKKHVCDTADCGSGRCSGGEDPNEWGENYFCFKCAKPNGGQRCEISDPCGTLSGNSPCSGSKPRCKTSSLKEEGYYCKSAKRSSLDDFLEHLDEDADQEPYHEIRMMMARSESPEEGLANYVRSFLG